MYTGTHLWVTSVQCNQVNNLLTYSVYFRITTSVSILQSHTLRMTTASAIMFKMPDISILQCPRHHHQSVNNPLTISIPPTQGSAAASDMDLDQLLQTWIPSPTGRPSSNQDLPGEDLPTQQGDTPLNRETQQGDSPQVQPTHPPIGDGGLRSSLTKVSHRVLTSLPSRYNIRMTSSPSEDLPTSDHHLNPGKSPGNIHIWWKTPGYVCKYTQKQQILSFSPGGNTVEPSKRDIYSICII